MAKFLIFWNSGNYQIIFLLKITKSHLNFLPIKFHSDALIKKITFYLQVFSSFYPIFLIERIRYILKEKLLCSQ